MLHKSALILFPTKPPRHSGWGWRGRGSYMREGIVKMISVYDGVIEVICFEKGINFRF